MLLQKIRAFDSVLKHKLHKAVEPSKLKKCSSEHARARFPELMVQLLEHIEVLFQPRTLLTVAVKRPHTLILILRFHVV